MLRALDDDERGTEHHAKKSRESRTALGPLSGTKGHFGW